MSTPRPPRRIVRIVVNLAVLEVIAGAVVCLMPDESPKFIIGGILCLLIVLTLAGIFVIACLSSNRHD